MKNVNNKSLGAHKDLNSKQLYEGNLASLNVTRDLKLLFVCVAQLVAPSPVYEPYFNIGRNFVNASRQTPYNVGSRLEFFNRLVQAHGVSTTTTANNEKILLLKPLGL